MQECEATVQRGGILGEGNRAMTRGEVAKVETTVATRASEHTFQHSWLRDLVRRQVSRLEFGKK